MENPLKAEIVKRHNYKIAFHMLCIKMGLVKEYSWYILRRSPDLCQNEGRKNFIKKITRILALNYRGIHNGEAPEYSPRLLPESNPRSEPIIYPPEFSNDVT